jgi:two-component system chemotaxis response regulator CheB
MLVDDSAIVRGMMSRAFDGVPSIRVVATASDGEMACRVVTQHAIDVIVLDIEMPKMDGMSALPELLRLSPNSSVIMASTLSERNAEISLRALALGAADYVPKPSSTSKDPNASANFYRELIDKIVALGTQRQKQLGIVRIAPAVVGQPSPVVPIASKRDLRTPDKQIVYPTHPVQAIAIASSTGGPQALLSVMKKLYQAPVKVPIFITQHMPEKFTTLLAQHLTQDANCECAEGVHGEIVKPGRVYIAPGNFHMVLQSTANGVQLALNQEAPVNFCRPSADPMLMSLASIYQRHLLTVVLTGMGSDGLSGAREVVAKGGSVIAQDEASSVVWGMPGAVANANLCKAVLPLDEIPAYLQQALKRVSYAS